MATVEYLLDRYLDPVTDALTPAAAKRILGLQPDPAVMDRVRELGAKCNAGALSDAERDEYRALADTGTLIALLKAKARAALARSAG